MSARWQTTTPGRSGLVVQLELYVRWVFMHTQKRVCLSGIQHAFSEAVDRCVSRDPDAARQATSSRTFLNGAMGTAMLDDTEVAQLVHPERNEKWSGTAGRLKAFWYVIVK